MTARQKQRPNDRELRLYCAAPSSFLDHWSFVVFYPDYDFVEGAYASLDVSEPLGECVTPPVLPDPCFWEAP